MSKWFLLKVAKLKLTQIAMEVVVLVRNCKTVVLIVRLIQIEQNSCLQVAVDKTQVATEMF